MKKIADLLPEVLANIRRKVDDPKEAIVEVWQELIGEKMAHLTEIISLQDQTLTVKVKSSTLYSLLATHEKPRLLKQLQKQFSIRKIVFRVG